MAYVHLPLTVTSIVYSYDGTNCNGNTCDTCNSDGKTAFSLLIIALISSVVAGGLHGIMITATANSILRIASLVFSLIGFLASLIAVGTFMGGCYASAVSDVDDGSFNWGPGASLTIVGMFIMVAVTGQTIWQLCVGDKSEQQQSLNNSANSSAQNAV